MIPKILRFARRHWFLTGYSLLLLFSHVYRTFQQAPVSYPAEKKITEVRVVDQGKRLERTAFFAWREYSPAAVDSLPIVILLHGSPMGSETFDNLGPELGKNFRTFSLDLPGFGHSTRNLPDYSISAHGDYVLQFMQQNDLPAAHIVGYSMGGGVALHLGESAPDRVRSLTMLSAIGVQEMELLGNFHMNRSVHAAQYAALWLLLEVTPHFGLFDGSMLNLQYARNFYDTDQRPLRRLLQNWQGPMLIQHGETDRFVSFAVAKEHHRIVPQSELAVYQIGHNLAFSSRGWPQVARDLVQFIRKVEQGEAQSRATADPARISAAAEPFDPAVIPPAQGITWLVIVLLIAVATLISEDLACIGAGLLVTQGVLSFFSGSAAAFMGIFWGDLLLYWAGKYFGGPMLNKAPLKWMVKKSDIEKSARWFEMRGPAIIIASRFLPGSRLPTYVAAGILQMGFWQFAFYLFVAGVVWTPILVWLAMALGQQLFELFDVYQKYALPTLIGVIILIYLVFKLIVPMLTHKGRRLLLSKWHRTTRWEFWPPWIFYVPVVFYIIYLSIKHRSLTLFTAANPGIPESGFVGESKSKILRKLENAGEFVARFFLIPNNLHPNERIEYAERFMGDHSYDFPIVLKPDSGERGEGVAVVRSKYELSKYLRAIEQDTIIQEYAPGEEFGVFYIRRPGEEKGMIFSITDKRFPTVVGDGRTELERLIIDHKRAVSMASFYLEKHRENLHMILPEGERLQLVELGTHCRGALFLDGAQLITPALEIKIDKISRQFEGFYFGRYDIRTPSLEDFKNGRNFKIVELNGVTSEATNIYDPKNSLTSAYRTLMMQWRAAFEIGELNRQNGHHPATISRIVILLKARFFSDA